MTLDTLWQFFFWWRIAIFNRFQAVVDLHIDHVPLHSLIFSAGRSSFGDPASSTSPSVSTRSRPFSDRNFLVLFDTPELQHPIGSCHVPTSPTSCYHSPTSLSQELQGVHVDHLNLQLVQVEVFLGQPDDLALLGMIGGTWAGETPKRDGFSNNKNVEMFTKTFS